MNARTPGLWPSEDDATTGWVGVQVQRLNTHTAPPNHAEPDHVIDEQPVALVFNGLSHVVMMATPTHLDDLGVGFALSEGLIADVGALRDVAVERHAQGLSVHLEVSPQAFARLKERRRQLAGRTGCGLCGIDSLQAFRADWPAPLPAHTVQALAERPASAWHAAIGQAWAQLPAHQPLQALTGGCHAAARADDTGQITLVREDVGRHNALDKLIGAAAREGLLHTPGGLTLVSSRASYEMVSKCVRVGWGVLAAVSAPTGLAVELAQASGLQLFGFCRGPQAVAYTSA
jgi:FdhD protein